MSTAVSIVAIVAMLMWLWAAWQAQKVMTQYLHYQQHLRARNAQTETAISELIQQLDLDPEALANQVAEKVASRMRAEERRRTRSIIKELQVLIDQLRTIAPTVCDELKASCARPIGRLLCAS